MYPKCVELRIAITDICTMHECHLLLGSNQGDRVGFLEKAHVALSRIGQLSSVSALYETEAWGLTDQPAFLNQTLCLITPLDPTELLVEILRIELELGRTRGIKYGPRTIDIDILLYEDRIHQSDQLILPHPELPNRRFALTALAEIAGSRIHPTLNCSIRELLEKCPDPLAVKRIS